jgi:hypothetical protein
MQVWDQSDYSRRPRPGAPGIWVQGARPSQTLAAMTRCPIGVFAAMSLASRLAYHL